MKAFDAGQRQGARGHKTSHLSRQRHRAWTERKKRTRAAGERASRERVGEGNHKQTARARGARSVEKKGEEEHTHKNAAVVLFFVVREKRPPRGRTRLCGAGGAEKERGGRGDGGKMRAAKQRRRPGTERRPAGTGQKKGALGSGGGGVWASLVGRAIGGVKWSGKRGRRYNLPAHSRRRRRRRRAGGQGRAPLPRRRRGASPRAPALLRSALPAIGCSGGTAASRASRLGPPRALQRARGPVGKGRLERGRLWGALK